jgi:hypothetical protein
MTLAAAVGRTRGESGVALVIAVMAVALLSALGLSMAVLSVVETRIAGNYSHALEARNAAEGALELGIHALRQAADWDEVAAGAVMSPFVDGAADSAKPLSDGSTLNPAQITAMLGEPGWQLFAYGPLAALAGVPGSGVYVIVWAGPDPAGRGGVMALRAEAFAAGGTRRAVQAAISRTAVLSWWNR